MKNLFIALTVLATVHAVADDNLFSTQTVVTTKSVTNPAAAIPLTVDLATYEKYNAKADEAIVADLKDLTLQKAELTSHEDGHAPNATYTGLLIQKNIEDARDKSDKAEQACNDDRACILKARAQYKADMTKVMARLRAEDAKFEPAIQSLNAALIAQLVKSALEARSPKTILKTNGQAIQITNVANTRVIKFTLALQGIAFIQDITIEAKGYGINTYQSAYLDSSYSLGLITRNTDGNSEADNQIKQQNHDMLVSSYFSEKPKDSLYHDLTSEGSAFLALLKNDGMIPIPQPKTVIDVDFQSLGKATVTIQALN